MATSWITGVCLRQNRLEWTTLRRTKEAWEIAGQGREEWPPADGDAGWISAAAIKPHLKRLKGQVSVALPTDRVLLRVALLPSTDAAELRGMAELQTDRFSPFPVETMALGAEVLDASETSSLVALAAVRREEVEALGHAFQEAGPPPDVVDVEALGWWWGLKHGGHVPAHGSQIFLRADAAGVEMTVARDGKPLLFRALPAPPPAGADGARDEWIGECAEEMLYSLTALETEWGGAGTMTLHVFPAADVAGEWAESLRKALGLEALFTHALETLPTVSEGIARRQAEPARLLALGVFWTLLNVQRGRMARLQAEVEAMETPALAIRRLQAKVLEFSLYADRTYSALECLRVISESLPPGVELTSFIYRKGASLSLRGEADAPDKVYGFIQALEQMTLFPEVKSEGISTRNTPRGSRSQFGVTIRLPGTGEGET